MRRIVIGAITMVAGWLGWWVGDKIGLMTAFVLSMVGTGAGMYFSRRFLDF